jgi:hypothetical protein
LLVGGSRTDRKTLFARCVDALGECPVSRAWQQGLVTDPCRNRVSGALAEVIAMQPVTGVWPVLLTSREPPGSRNPGSQHESERAKREVADPER